MKNKKLIVVVSILTVMVLGLATVSYAFDFKSPAEIIAGLTGKSVEQVIKDRQAGNSFGEQALDADKLDEFHDLTLEQLKARLAELVQEGRLTQEQADARLKAMETRITDCDGTCTPSGQAGFGGMGGGMGGNGLRDGSGAGQGMQGGRGGRGGMGGMGGYGARDGSGVQNGTKTAA